MCPIISSYSLPVSFLQPQKLDDWRNLRDDDVDDDVDDDDDDDDDDKEASWGKD